MDETLLGTTERDDGSLQVTYNDWPLYYYFDDPQPGDVNGQGANDVWYVLDPAGEMIMTEMMEEEAMDEGGDSEMSAETFEVGIEDSRFTPGEVTINVGDTVVWTSSASFNHTVTSDDGTFSSGTLSGGNSFDFTFTEPGTYAYYCDFHGGPGGTGMSGVITVNP